MRILLVGPSGTGKSALGDLIRNLIIKMDENARVINKDPDKQTPVFGIGSRDYTIETQQCKLSELPVEKEVEYDLVIGITGPKFKEWFKEVYI